MIGALAHRLVSALEARGVVDHGAPGEGRIVTSPERWTLHDLEVQGALLRGRDKNPCCGEICGLFALVLGGHGGALDHAGMDELRELLGPSEAA